MASPDTPKKKPSREQQAAARGEAREKQLQEQAKSLAGKDLMSIAQDELDNGQGDKQAGKRSKGQPRGSDFQHDTDDAEKEAGKQEGSDFVLDCLNGIIYLFTTPPLPPPPWTTYRREEMETYIERKLRSPIWGVLTPWQGFWYWVHSNQRLKYSGEYDKRNPTVRCGRGVCKWPDPARGGGGEQRFLDNERHRLAHDDEHEFVLRAPTLGLNC